MRESKSLLSNLGVPASSAQQATQKREMLESLKRQETGRLAEQERSRLSDIESRKRWEATYAAMNLDDIIEMPGKRGGKDIVIRAIVGPDGRLKEVE